MCTSFGVNSNVDLGCGAACQLGYLADIPCLGVAKKLLVVDGVSVKQIEQRQAKEGGKLTKILGASGKLHGMVRTLCNVLVVTLSLISFISRHLKLLLEMICCSYRVVI